MPRSLAWGHGKGAIKISSRFRKKILKRVHCPKGGLKAGGFTLCLVAAITEWQPRGSQGHPSKTTATHFLKQVVMSVYHRV